MAYNTLDFSGRGYLFKEDILNSIVAKRMLTQVSEDDIKMSFDMNNLFTGHSINKKTHDSPNDGMDFDTFKKVYFPHLNAVAQEDVSDEEDHICKTKKELEANQERQPQIIEERLKKLEKFMRAKFCNSYETVRKAFLALDADFDGYVTVEDIYKRFSSEKNISFDDLNKLVLDKDSRKKGLIDYADFSRWMGSYIHQSEGFYFRHDSCKNPSYDLHEVTFNKKTELMEATN
jgi:hypothetical protein